METSSFVEFIRLVVAGDTDRVSRRLRAAPALATTAAPVGATRQQAAEFFFTTIAHYLYVGDTALHMAAAAFSRPIAELLMTHGADCRARNRRGQKTTVVWASKRWPVPSPLPAESALRAWCFASWNPLIPPVRRR